MRVRIGEFYTLLGPNGAGKTTTLRMVTGLLKPDRGSITVFGIDVLADPVGAKQVTQQVQTTPFSFLQKAESENLLTFIQDEHPQTIALIVAHLDPIRKSETIRRLPDALVELPAAARQQALVRHVLREGVSEGVLHLRIAGVLHNQRTPLEMGQIGIQRRTGPRNCKQDSIQKRPSDHGRVLHHITRLCKE